MLDRFPYFTKGDHFVGYYKFKDEKTVLYKYLNSVVIIFRFHPISSFY